MLWLSGSTHTRYGVRRILSRKTRKKIKILLILLPERGLNTIKHGYLQVVPEDAPDSGRGLFQ
jgi:hypothetical protein